MKKISPPRKIILSNVLSKVLLLNKLKKRVMKVEYCLTHLETSNSLLGLLSKHVYTIQVLAVAVPALLYCPDNVTLLKFL
jgi:hypothetical protein